MSEPDDELAPVRNGPPPGYLDRDPLAKYLLAKLEREEKRREEADMTLPKQRFDWTINTGHVLTILTIVIGMILAYGGWAAGMEKLNGQIDQNRRDIAANSEADRLRTSTYVPQIDELKRMVASLAGRQDNQGDALTQLRGIVTDLAKSTAEMHESLAIMKMQQDRAGH